MQGFRPRDYIVSALIIIGVLVAWFFIMAGLMGIADRQFSFALTIIISIIVYVMIKRSQNKHKP